VLVVVGASVDIKIEEGIVLLPIDQILCKSWLNLN